MSPIVVLVLVLLTGLGVSCTDIMAEADRQFAEHDYDGAEAAYRAILESDIDHVDALRGLAVVLMLQGRFNDALSMQEKVIAVDPSDATTRIELGFNYLNHQNRPEDAVRIFTESVILDGSAKNLNFLAQAQESVGNNNEAESTLRHAIEVDPAYVYSYTSLIKLLQKNRRDFEAAQVLELAGKNGISIDTAHFVR